MKLAPLGNGQQFVIRDAAPKEKRKARCQRKVADAIDAARLGGWRVLFNAEKKLGTDQDGAQGRFNARLETVFRLCLAIEVNRLPKVGAGHWTPVRAVHQSGKDPLGARILLAGIRGHAHEETAPAGRVSRTLRLVRAVDGYLVNGRCLPWMPVHVIVRLVWLAPGLDQRRWVLKKRNSQLMRPGGDRHAHFEMRIHFLKILVAGRGRNPE